MVPRSRPHEWQDVRGLFALAIEAISKHMLEAEETGEERDEEGIELAADAVVADGAVDFAFAASELIAAAAEDVVEPLLRQSREVAGVAGQVDGEAADERAVFLAAETISAGMVGKADGHAAVAGQNVLRL